MEKKRMSLAMLLGFIPFLLAFTFGGEIRFDPPTKFQVDNRCGNAKFIDIVPGDVDGDGDVDLIMIKTIYGSASSCANVQQNEVRVYFNQYVEEGGNFSNVVAIEKLFFPRPGQGPNDTTIDAADGKQKMAVIYRDGWKTDSAFPVYNRWQGGINPSCINDCCQDIPGTENYDMRAPLKRLAVAYKNANVGGTVRRVVDFIVVSRQYQGSDSYYNNNALYRNSGRIIHLKNPFDGTNPGETMLPWPAMNGRGDQSVFCYNGNMSIHNDKTAESRTPGGTDYAIFAATNDYFYVGDSSKFGAINFGLKTAGAGVTLAAEYYGSAGMSPGWKTLTVVSDGTNNLSTSGTITFSMPSDWVAYNLPGPSVTKYWVRFKTTSVPTTAPTAYWSVIAHPGYERHFTCTTAAVDFYTDDYTFKARNWHTNYGYEWQATFNAMELADIDRDGDYDLYVAPYSKNNNLQYAPACIYRYRNTSPFSADYNDANYSANQIWSDTSTGGSYNQFWDFHIVNMNGDGRAVTVGGNTFTCGDGIPDLLGQQGSGSWAYLSWIRGAAGGGFSDSKCKGREITPPGTMIDIWAGSLRSVQGQAPPADNPCLFPDLVCARDTEPMIQISMYSDTRKNRTPPPPEPSASTYSEWITVYRVPDSDYQNNADLWHWNCGFSKVITADVDGCGMNEIIALTGHPSGRAQFWIFKNSASRHAVRYLTMNLVSDEPLFRFSERDE